MLILLRASQINIYANRLRKKHNPVVPGHYQHKHCHYCSNNHYSIPSVTYVYLFILDVE